ncbi:MAG: thiamine phosphate synthase [Candidatus Berkiella sp.]
MSSVDVWTIAGFDPSAKAGVLVDRQLFSILGLKSHALITALTAQHDKAMTRVRPVDIHLFSEQFLLLKQCGWPKVIKIGLLPTKEYVQCLAQLLADFPGKIVYDPVMQASVGPRLMASDAVVLIKSLLLPRITIMTPNLYEAHCLTEIPIHTSVDMQQAANQLHQMGVSEVILKGGHLDGVFAQDLWSDGQRRYWLTLPRLHGVSLHGSGCIFSATLAGMLATEDNSLDAFVMAKMVTYQALNAQCAPLRVDENADHFPWLTNTIEEGQERLSFAQVTKPLGLYTIINEIAWLKRLSAWGVRTLQWRDKEQSQAATARIIEVTNFLRKKEVQLFINDDWQTALKCQAYGVHLGQEDLDNANLKCIADSGLRLGVSTHSLSELARAKALNPSYIAFGPIFPTTTKRMIFPPQGLAKLATWRKWVENPLVAIGGINLHNIQEILATGVDSVAMISAVTKAANPRLACQQLLSYFKKNHALSKTSPAPTSR